ncbi:tripartite tricarboxylate transporter substrate-binding protein [Haloplanus natans]|uniref:tripartite tricarboxylate transporter substrate-binding protein n=1 Tax=Haloplanus natans TaxID=376171 RepID=UPI0006775E59|nr:tripartite tricarboxylate transporter substrate-binding protein [Haloplanus natans]
MRSKLSRRRMLQTAGTVGLVGVAGCSGGGGGGGSGDGGSGGDGGSDGDTSVEFTDTSWRPNRNVRVIIPWGAGGGTDTMTRGVMNPAQELASEQGVNVNLTFENITGANGLNAARRVLNNPADGYTLFPSTNSISPHIATGQADFTLDDWGYVARVQHDTSWLYSSGRDGTGHDNISSLVEKAEGGDTVNIGAVGGVTGAAFAVLVAEAAGITDNTNIVTYQDAGRMTTDTISGEIDAAYGEIQELQSQYEAGDISLIVVGVEDRLDDFPDVPTTVENGWDVTYGLSRGFNVKAGTPDDATQFWSDFVQLGMGSDQYQQLEQETLLYFREGYQGPDGFRETMANEVSIYQEVVSALDM